MTRSPEMAFKMQAHASALLAMGGRSTTMDQLKLARTVLDLQPLPPPYGSAVQTFLADVRVDAARAGIALRDFVLSVLPPDGNGAQPRRYDWQDRADLQ